MSKITSKTLREAVPKSTAYFIRDSKLKGFAVKVNPSGSVKFIAEVFHEGKSKRKTVGSYPLINLTQTRQNAVSFIQDVKLGIYKKHKEVKPLGELFLDYIKGDRLKPNTIKDYNNVIPFYLSDWMDKPVASITKQMVEKRFYRIRDKGISGGIPTYSQATKTMRILSALMNYAIADELIESNPVNVLKFKRIDRSIRKREQYLSATKVRELLDISSVETHLVTLAVHLMPLQWHEKERGSRVKMERYRGGKGHPLPTYSSKIPRTTDHTMYLLPLRSRRYLIGQRTIQLIYFPLLRRRIAILRMSDLL